MKTDARVRYTRLRIREAFMECIAGKPMNKVTVKEICDRAEINRATFYAHYRDPYDLLDCLENETLRELREMVLNAGQGEQPSLLCRLLHALDGDDHTFSRFSSPDVDPGFNAKIGSLFHELMITDVAVRLPEANQDTQDRVYHFLAGGCGNLITKWLEEGMQTKGEQLAEDLENMCRVFVGAFREQLPLLTDRRKKE